MKYWHIFVLAVLFSSALTGILRRYALLRKIVDIPNSRSSHTEDTPRGGGLAVVLVFSLCLLFPSVNDQLPLSLLVALFSGVWVALVGFCDDHSHIPARWRLLVHFAAAVWALFWLGGMPPVAAFGGVFYLGWLGHLLAVFYFVWLLNLYNFMDGIDGIAGIEAVTVCLGGALVYTFVFPDGEGWVLPVLLATSVAGFLFWNYPRAKIFMGDVGSGFIGFMLGILSIYAACLSFILFWCWLILLGVFVVDATVTLFRRILRGEKFYEPHRNHAYQYASRKHGAHWPVSTAVAIINILWLLPIALLVAVGQLGGVVGVVVGYGPLIWLAFRYKAGARDLLSF